MKYRKKIKKRTSKKMFKRSSLRTHKVNLPKLQRRGGMRF